MEERPGVLWTLGLVALVAIASIGIGLTIGVAVAGRPASSIPPPISASQYARVRAANIGPLEQALDQVPLDCVGSDADRCRLSIAYALALAQKFQAELMDAPPCHDLSDAELRTGLVELDPELHAAADDVNLARTAISGASHLAVSDGLFNAEVCTGR
jgi:hypothetical protein